jgi:leucyl aminopeptidase
MRSVAITGNFPEANVEALAAVVFKGEKATSGGLKELNAVTGGLLGSLIGSDEFKGESGETSLVRFARKGKVKASRLLLIGGGDKNEFQAHNVAMAAGTAVRFFNKQKVKSVALSVRSSLDAAAVGQAAMQGAITSTFELDKYRSADKSKQTVTTFGIHVEGAKPAEIKKGITRGEILGDSMNFTRDLANEPPNILTPTEMANRAQAMAGARTGDGAVRRQGAYR